jgi:hypothetical protein
MTENVVLGMAVKAKGKFLARRNRTGKGMMNVFLVLFVLFWVAAGTVDVDESFPEMEIGIGVLMAVDTYQFSKVVDVSGPFFWIHIE